MCKNWLTKLPVLKCHTSRSKQVSRALEHIEIEREYSNVPIKADLTETFEVFKKAFPFDEHLL